MRIGLFGVLFLGFVFNSVVIPNVCLAQSPRYPPGTFKLVTADGEQILATVESEDDSTLVLRDMQEALHRVRRDNVKSMVSIEGRRFHRTDPAQSRLFLASTARPMAKADVRLTTWEIFFPEISVGVTDALSLSGGVSVLPQDNGDGQILYIQPKVTFYTRPMLDVAAGSWVVWYLGNTAGDDPQWAGLLYLVSTFGTIERSVTLGLAAGTQDSEAPGGIGIIIGGDIQVSNRVKFLTENYVFPGLEGGWLATFGTRIFGNHLSLDLAVATTPDLWDEFDLPLFPWLGLSFRF